ncbi:hypothetical protein RUM44_010333 [Polyplax serrata]|uniref:G-protein coupled receptors family 1 profile domain-containing protein n=1 Tax=Polyplax serrata TaxID=468196 RepID=A0ABR1AV78_POLSC
MNFIRDENDHGLESNSIYRTKFLRLPEGHEYESGHEATYPTVPSVDFRSGLPVRHHHLSYMYSRRVATEIGDLINKNLMEAMSPGVEHNETDVNFELLSGVYANSSTGNQTEHHHHHDYLYRHSPALTIVYCIAYFLVFAIGLVGNCLVVAVVFRAPRMRTVTNLFIVNLAIADILVVVLCIPATLLGNIFVRK